MGAVSRGKNVGFSAQVDRVLGDELSLLDDEHWGFLHVAYSNVFFVGTH